MKGAELVVGVIRRSAEWQVQFNPNGPRVYGFAPGGSSTLPLSGPKNQVWPYQTERKDLADSGLLQHG